MINTKSKIKQKNSLLIINFLECRIYCIFVMLKLINLNPSLARKNGKFTIVSFFDWKFHSVTVFRRTKSTYINIGVFLFVFVLTSWFTSNVAASNGFTSFFTKSTLGDRALLYARQSLLFSNRHARVLARSLAIILVASAL